MDKIIKKPDKSMGSPELPSRKRCCGCSACESICPEDAIVMKTDSEGFLYPNVDDAECINCGLCTSVCPINKKDDKQRDAPSAFAAWNLDDDIRSLSSSGGVFSVLMHSVFKNDGIVYGAAFDDDMRLYHQCATNMSDGQKFRGAKYIQSIIGSSYKQIRTHLKNGKEVLFSGTPCQVAGLYGFLKGDKKKLLTCEVVCHGVASPKVFTSYLRYMEKKYGAPVQKTSFRHKKTGWKNFSMSITFVNNSEYSCIARRDPFMRGFLQNIFLRPSCHHCEFARIPREADITLGDFWGVSRHHPQWDDDLGTSLVLIQSNKGRELLERCAQEMNFFEADLSAAIQYNPCITRPVEPHPSRDAFFEDLDRVPFDKVMRRYLMPPSVLDRCVKKIKGFLGGSASSKP